MNKTEKEIVERSTYTQMLAKLKAMQDQQQRRLPDKVNLRYEQLVRKILKPS